MTTTAWGEATVVEEASIAQTAQGKSFAALIQLLKSEDGGELVRFAYSTGGTARRGPVALRGKDIDKLRSALAKTPRLRAVLANLVRK